MKPLAIVAGSGIDLLPLLDEVVEEIPFSKFGSDGTNVPGHARVFVLGRCAGREVILQRGRFHVYEGLPMSTVCAPVDWLSELGAGEIVFTNAVGGLANVLRPGDLVAINELRAWPCVKRNGPETVTPSHTIDGCAHAGSYWWMHGPCYETRAEIAALRALGGSVVGMSTLPEVERALALGIRSAVISCVTNVCGSGPVTHGEVTQTAGQFSCHLREALRAHVVALSEK